MVFHTKILEAHQEVSVGRTMELFRVISHECHIGIHPVLSVVALVLVLYSQETQGEAPHLGLTFKKKQRFLLHTSVSFMSTSFAWFPS